MPALIGQFGVGFYSAFIVADEVEVFSRAAGTDQGTRWCSTGEDTFTVEDAADLPRGTRVVLHLKPDASEFADGFRLRSIIRKYSDHIGVPVRLAGRGAEGCRQPDRRPTGKGRCARTGGRELCQSSVDAFPVGHQRR